MYTPFNLIIIIKMDQNKSIMNVSRAERFVVIHVAHTLNTLLMLILN